MNYIFIASTKLHADESHTQSNGAQSTVNSVAIKPGRLLKSLREFSPGVEGHMTKSASPAITNAWYTVERMKDPKSNLANVCVNSLVTKPMYDKQLAMHFV
jgi:hypothetical protein